VEFLGAYDFNTENYIYLSSCDIYPDFSKSELTQEAGIIDVAKQRPYGFHKYLAEQCVKHSAKRWLNVRLGGLIGPNLIKNPVFDILNGQPLWLDPTSQMQFINTDDVAKIVFELVKQKLSNTTINVCGDGFITLEEVIDAVKKPIEIRENSPKVQYDVSIDKLKKIMSVPTTRETVLNFVNTFAIAY
jgi:nucleoside-diphosphate-sugar epimerase